jgi:hypothetical protein
VPRLINAVEIVKAANLKPREIKFLVAYFEAIGRGSRSAQYEAYCEIFPNSDRPKAGAQKTASNIYARIKRKIGDFDTFMDLSGIGMTRVAEEIQALLRATKTEFYQGKLVKDENGEVIQIPDNATRMRALEVLADLHGLRKHEVKLSGQITTRTEPDLSRLADDELDTLEHITERAYNQN